MDPRTPISATAPCATTDPWASSVALECVVSMLEEAGQLGLLSITVLQQSAAVNNAWGDYEQTLSRIADLLDDYTRGEMRDGDVLFEPVSTGNSFLLFLGPPRADRRLGVRDLEVVRRRLSRRLSEQLARSLPAAALQRFGVYVGVAVLQHEPAVSSSLILNRAVESAFADAVRQKRGEATRQAEHLSRILHRGSIFSVYQPVVDLGQRGVVGYEALTRPVDSCLTRPDQLFEIARREGLLWRLERLSRRRALEGLPRLGAEQLLFLNVEPESLHDPKLGDSRFLRRLQDAGLRPEQVVLEITERSAMRDFDAVRDRLRYFRSLGFRMAMDDVGSGYAGLQAVAEIGPEYLKVDMSLVRNLDQHAIKRELILSIRRFTERTGTTMIAEGVESSSELASLVAAGVRCAQGYLFAAPGSPPTIPDWSALADPDV